MAIKPSILSNNYVKFVRTNAQLFNSLIDRNNDTLYFVVENGATKGSLYLGNALIATSIDEGLKLEDLINVALDQAVADDVLIFDGSNWINTSIHNFTPPVMKGATANEDGAGGLVPVPVKGQQELFLRGDGTWVDPTIAVAADVAELSKTLQSVQGTLDGVIGEDVGSTIREVALDVTNTAITDLVNGAPEAFNTLKEIADWITGDHEGSMDAADLITKVTNLDNVVNNETTGLVKRVSTLENTSAGLVTTVNNLVDQIGDGSYGLSFDVATNANNIATNTTEIEKLQDALKWNTLVDDATV